MSGLRGLAKGMKEARFATYLEFSVQFALIFLCVGEAVPGINESHYLPKAKHFWAPDFAPGDLFLDSHDSHLLASSIAGLATLALPFSTVAWLGRIACWAFLAIAWCRLARSLAIPSLVRPLALASWLLGVAHGHWAGEWVAGGFEAKTVAYPFALLGLAGMVRDDWKRAWLWLGCSVAWHPLVGGWAGLSVGLVWLTQPQLLKRFHQQWTWLAVGGAVALIGVLPAISGLGGPAVVDKVSAAQVHAYLRLPHHLIPQLFAPERHLAASLSLLVFIGSTLIYRFALRRTHDESSQGFSRLLKCAWFAVLFALIGLVVDWALSTKRPDIASSLLRFYWFRWADAVVPLVSSLVIWKWLAGINHLALQTAREPSAAPVSPIARGLLTLAVLATIGLLLGRLPRSDARTLPAADRLVVQSVGRIPRNTNDRYVDWLAVCQWIRQNTPTDSLWFTPKYQQSFKWYAQRAEVVCWKDVPQDNAAVIEWYHRIQRCEPPRDRENMVRDWTTEELLNLSREYGFRWVLLDRTNQADAPALEIMYPVADSGYYIDNRSFAVFRIPEWMLEQGR